ncbi:MAG: NADH-quinone oxidoreductase subunit NuoN [Micromonosporaceae bacterium]|nr:NADH-quinone oxidoreductase subunit NuoN [Micromonosporaceae bacterium]
MAAEVLARSLAEPAVLAADVKLPDIDYLAIAPMLVLFGAACVGVLAAAFVPQRLRYRVQVSLVIGALLVALGLIVTVARAGRAVATAGGAIAIDGPALFLQGSVAVLGVVAVLLIAERSLERGGAFVSRASLTPGSAADRDQAEQPGATEVYPLVSFALAGMMLFVSANDLLTLFVALEVFSLPLYLLCGLARRRRLLSQESAVKYFLLGAFSSAFFLYGVALLYGFAGATGLGALRKAVQAGDGNTTLLFLGLAMLAVGLLFKVAAVPFHVWTPDVYQGAPTPITALMAACTKVAAFGALLRVFTVAFPVGAVDWRPVLVAIAIATMLVGAVLAVTQTDIKRLLAYSSIANAGYVLTGVLALSAAGVAGSLFYLVAYGFVVLAAFGVVTLVRDADGEATHLSRWAGLGRRSPLVAGVFTFLMMAFAGIPLTSGFTSKFAVFSAALGSGQVTLVVVGVLSSAVLAFPYLRVVVLMYLSEPAEDTPTVSLPGTLTAAALAIGVLATALLGVAPAPVLDLAAKAVQFVS